MFCSILHRTDNIIRNNFTPELKKCSATEEFYAVRMNYILVPDAAALRARTMGKKINWP